MNFEKAIEILELQHNFTDKELKKSYYKNAIKFHPDKNNGAKEKEEIFKQINEAYKYLCNKSNREYIEDTSFSYIVKRCFDFMSPNHPFSKSDIHDAMTSIIMKCKNASVKIFEKISKERSLDIYHFLSNHKDILSIDTELLKEIEIIIKEKIKNDNIIILNPDIEDLLNDNIYKFELKNKLYYIPLWFNELVFDDSSGNDIIFRCIPDLSENIYIENDNNLHIKVIRNISDVLNDKKIEIKLGTKTFFIDSFQLKIVKHQIIKMKQKGVLEEDINNIFNDGIRKDIYFHISLK
jgi:DnaJ-class molecular chaperone